MAPSSIGRVGEYAAMRTRPFDQFNLQQNDKLRWLAVIDKFAKGQAQKRAEREAEDSGGGGIGALLGMLGSVVLSPFTAGASLAWLPAATAAGGAIGTAVDPPGGPAGARRNQAYQTAASVASPFVGATSAGFMSPNPSPHNMPNPTFWDSFSNQLESYGVLGAQNRGLTELGWDP